MTKDIEFDHSNQPKELRAEFELEDAMLDAEEEMEIAEILKDCTLREKEMFFEGARRRLDYLAIRLEWHRRQIEKAKERNERLHNI